MVRVALRIAPFSKLRRWLEARRATTVIARPEWPFDVRRAVDRAGRALPGSSCLARAVVAELLLRQGGHPARLTIGVAPTEALRPGSLAEPLDAHAWVESAGVLVVGDEGRERYAPLTSAGTRA